MLRYTYDIQFERSGSSSISSFSSFACNPQDDLRVSQFRFHFGRSTAHWPTTVLGGHRRRENPLQDNELGRCGRDHSQSRLVWNPEGISLLCYFARNGILLDRFFLRAHNKVKYWERRMGHSGWLVEESSLGLGGSRRTD
jgi:hypothetical protein